VLNELDCIGPMQAPWQFAMEQGLMKLCKLTMEVDGHIPKHLTITCIEWNMSRNETSLGCHEYR
jgi:hypothetical protein